MAKRSLAGNRHPVRIYVRLGGSGSNGAVLHCLVPRLTLCERISMNKWQVTIRTDEGRKKWAVVEAADTAAAIEASGADGPSIRSIKMINEKRLPVPGILAAIGLFAYVGAIMLADWRSELSEVAFWVSLSLFVLFVAGMSLMCVRRAKRAVGQSPVTWQGIPGDDSESLRAVRTFAMWLIPLTAIGMAYGVITGMGGEEALSPSDVLDPIFVFAMALIISLNA